MFSHFLSKSIFKSNNRQYLEISLLITKIRNIIWSLGIPCLFLGIVDRSIAAFADGSFTQTEAIQIFFTSLLLVSWAYLKPEPIPGQIQDLAISEEALEPSSEWEELYHKITKTRMAELQAHHLISQEYTLPFPYLCQIYHLLNLKHLENVHSFSLGNLRVLEVSHVEPTIGGGAIRFQTTLDSAMNALRIWRQPVVDAGLTLHTPYTVELSIPAYRGKTITVLFTALPLTENTHQLFIDIYSDLQWPKFILQAILHFSACLTLFEDLPYLQTLAEREIDRVFTIDRASNHETMWLFRRFVELYGAGEMPTFALPAGEA